VADINDTDYSSPVAPAPLPAPDPTDESAGALVSPTQLANRAAHFSTRLIEEIQPTSTLQAILVDQLGRHAAGMELGADCEAATLKFAVENCAVESMCAGFAPKEVGLIAAAASELVAKAARYRAQHERAFFSALRYLPAAWSAPQISSAPDLFLTEDACLHYLQRWHEHQPWQCSVCASQQRCWLRSRARFECTCGRQFSAREGTAFAGSHVPLLAWFRATAALVADPQVTPHVLCERIEVVRRGTVRAMAKRVLDALASPDADQQLAGLPQHIYTHLRKVSLRRSRADSRLTVETPSPSKASVPSFPEDFTDRTEVRRPR
jgi:hypothetical protein